ncbi:TonB-dependent receptor [Lutibacter sp. TH_r2]|uniref:TonB-dependent receptor n=1 Tax=Lutibacter sp. TH_r2 TaxID=3082083 RepID=UPI0029549CE7|nr:TonB-dependent receptor [Lutibacter sp. TH_r2]MDV7185802.1 TonB-dependent receptor [Lutibacter sp. TH_r2]
MRKLFIISILISSTFIYAQKKETDTLKTEEILVVKPYTPSIADAFKIKSNPSIEETKNIEKENVEYSIFSFPVASTFTPSKGKVKGVVRAPKERLFQNYISAGFGNYTSPLFEAYIHSGNNRYNDFGVFINHHSSEGGIDEVLLDDNFADTRIDLFYKQFDRDYNWQINAGVQRQVFNYYGLPSEVEFDEVLLNSIDEKQLYKNIYIGGKITMEDSFFQGASAEVNNFTDDYNSSEIRLVVKPKFEFPISTELINAEVLVDLISGKFKQNYTVEDDIKYSFLNLGFNPNFEVLRDNLTFNLGAKLYYSNNLEQKENNFYAYPNVTASLKIVDEVFTLVGGVTGDLIQNNYKDFANENPYVSPTLTIAQTDKQYKAFAGAKGKLASNIGYNFTVSHTSEKSKPLFIQNTILTDGTLAVDQAYQLGNSFGVVYDDVKTLGVNAGISIEASDKFTFGGIINYNNYSTTTQKEAWNLPDITATITGDYVSNSWFAGAKLFYVGATKDLVYSYGDMALDPTITENDSYLDLNLNGGYIFSERLTAFAKVNNALGTKYQPFLNYKVQTIQILAGITYKFDL